MVKNPALNQIIFLKDTGNRGLLLSTFAPPSFRSISKAGVVNLDLSTKKYIPILAMSSDMLSDNGTYLQDRRAGKLFVWMPSGRVSQFEEFQSSQSQSPADLGLRRGQKWG